MPSSSSRPGNRLQLLHPNASILLLPLLTALSLSLSSCATLKKPGPQPEVVSLDPAPSGALADVSREIHKRGGTVQSGFHLLERNDEGLAWRLALADHAQSSIDAQYFIWQGDEAGQLLLHRLIAAADRGVRVRILVDDLTLAGDDRAIATLCHHPNVDIKIFNPGFVRRGLFAPLVEFLIYFKELNRRMHNKLFVADNRMAIVGGRNIGNEYFGLSEKYNFRDLDVLVAGPLVPDISEAFDEYWNSEHAFPGKELSRAAKAKDLPKLRRRFARDMEKNRPLLAASPYPLERKDWSRDLRALPAKMHAGEAHMIQDEPVTHQGEQRRLVDTLDYLAAPSHEELLVVTPYLLPVGTFLEDLAKLSSEGVDVKILTGSMGSNNHTVAHSHYKKYRRPLIKTGATLREFKHQPTASVRAITDVPPATGKFVSLHTKTLVGDRTRCFIGSLNLDPRAIILNTENGLLIDSPGLSKELAARIDDWSTPENAWQVTVDDRKRLRWESSEGTVTIQPARSFGQRISDFFFQFLPIESQL